MKTFTKKILPLLMPAIMSAQTDLSIGLNYQYTPPSNCSNQITGLEIDICNNDNSPAGSFLVGAYLYQPSTQKYWVVDVKTVNSLSGNACLTISNWNIDLNSYPSLPSPGNYRLGIWADTANTISETNENNNAGLLSGTIQVCAPSGLEENNFSMTALSVFPNPVSGTGRISFELKSNSYVSAVLYDATGKITRELFAGELNRGNQDIAIDAGGLESGLYIIKLKTSQGSIHQRVVITR